MLRQWFARSPKRGRGNRLRSSPGASVLLCAALVIPFLAACTSNGASPPPTTATTSPSPSPSPSPAPAPARPAKNVDQTGAFSVTKVTAGNCKALLPADWPQPMTNENSTSFDAVSRDKSMYAGYNHPAVNTKLAPYASAYGPPLNDPDLYSNDPSTVTLAWAKIVVANLGGDRALSYTDGIDQAIGDYQLRSVASSTHTGVVFYHRTGFPGDGYNFTYSLPMYFALTTSSVWQASGLRVARVAASINCTAQVVPHAQGPDIGGNSSSDNTSHNKADIPNADYNPILGTQWVHDPNTGAIKDVDVTTDWSNNGPDGAGYYTVNGNDVTKLQPGLGS